MKAQLSVKREMSKAKAPVVAHFGAAVEGISKFYLGVAFMSSLIRCLWWFPSLYPCLRRSGVHLAQIRRQNR